MSNLSDIFYESASDVRYVRSPPGSVMAAHEDYDVPEFPSEPVMSIEDATALIRSFNPGDPIYIAQEDERCHGRVISVQEFRPGQWSIDLDVPASWFTDTYIAYDLTDGEVSISHTAEDL